MNTGENDEEFNFEADEEMGDLSGARAKIQKLKEQLKQAQQKRDEYLDGWQRERAENANAKRESFAAAEKSHARGKEAVFEELIPVLDSFDMATGSAAWEHIDPTWRGGMEQVKNQLLDILSRHDIERFGKAGEQFNHATDEALEERDDMPGESGEIVRVVRYGYKSKGRIIRPAQVVVKK